MFAPVRLRNFLLVFITLSLVIIFLFFSRKAHLLWFLALVPVFLAGWVWHRAGAVLIGAVTLGLTAAIVYLESLSQTITITFPGLLIQMAIGFALVLAVGIGVGRLSEVEAREEEIIRQVTIKDPVTELFAEKYFRLRLEEEIKRGERFDMPFSLLLISIDNLEKFRRTFGAFRKDQVLMKVSRIIEVSLRAVDLPSRNNDGFAVMLPGVNAGEAVMVAEKIRETVEKADFRGDDVEPRVKKTLSIGLAQFPLNAMEESKLYSTAGEALRQAEEKGGNRVVSSSASVK